MVLHKELTDELIELRHKKESLSAADLGQKLETWMERRLLPHIIENDALTLKSVPNPF